MSLKNSFKQISKEVKIAIANIVEMEETEVLDDMSLLNDLGIDSLDLLDLLTVLGKKYDIETSVEYWTETIHAESLKIGQIGPEKTLIAISEQTGLIFDEEDISKLNELLLGPYQTWDIVRNILSFITVKSLIKYVETKMVGFPK